MTDLNQLFTDACKDWDNGELALAFDKFYKASILGEASAQNNLGVFYEEGLGVSKSFIDAEYWYKRAVDGGNSSALNNLASLYRVMGRVTEAVDVYIKSVEAGDGDSMYELGLIYLSGDGVPKDISLAKKYLLQAINSDCITPDSKQKATDILRIENFN